MPGKWQILNGSRYPAEGFEDDCASSRSTEEKTHISTEKSHRRSPSATQTYNLRGRERISQVHKEMRKRTGTDYRELVAQRKAAALTIQKHFRGHLNRWVNVYEEPIYEKPIYEKPIYEQRSLIDRWMDGAEFLQEPEVEPLEESEEEPEEPEEMQCHPVGWTKKNHYSELGWQWCGQSCPCCRARVGDTLGACPVCIRERE